METEQDQKVEDVRDMLIEHSVPLIYRNRLFLQIMEDKDNKNKA